MRPIGRPRFASAAKNLKLPTVKYSIPLLLPCLLPTFTALQSSDAAETSSLALERKTYAPSEKIAVHFTAPADAPTNSWIGIIPAEIEHGSRSLNDKYDIQYQYLSGKTEGTYTFNPVKPGKWSFRTNILENETASVDFEVAEDVVPPGQNPPNLKLDRARFAPTEPIPVHFTAPEAYPTNSWIGIVPADIEHGSRALNDKHDVQYQYLSGQTEGTYIFNPVKPGKWSLRLNVFSIETASVDFEVANEVVPAGQNLPALALPRTEFAPGEKITVHFTAPALYPNNSWIGIVPADIEHGSRALNDKHDVQYQYLSGQTEGALAFNSPPLGDWTFRLNVFDTETASVAFTVTEDAHPAPAADAAFKMPVVKSTSDPLQSTPAKTSENKNQTIASHSEESVSLNDKQLVHVTSETINPPLEKLEKPTQSIQAKPQTASSQSPEKATPETEPTETPAPAEMPAWVKEMPPLPPVAPAKLIDEIDLRGITSTEYAGIVSQAKETVAELLGPMSPEQERAYDATWQPMFTYPAPECIDYLEQIIPIAEKALSMRVAILDASQQTSQLWEQAALAEYYSPEAAREIMMRVRDRTASLQSMKLTMDQLVAQIADLGNPPNPLALQAQAQARHRKAMRTLESLLSGVPDLEGFYERTASVSSSKSDADGNRIYIGKRSEEQLHTLAITPLQGSRGDLVLYSQLVYNEPNPEGTFADTILDSEFEDEYWNAWYAEATEDGWANYDFDEESQTIDVTFYRVGYDEMTVDHYWIYGDVIEASRQIYHKAPLDKGTKRFEDGQDEASIQKLVKENKEALREDELLFRKAKAAFEQYVATNGPLPQLANPEQLYWVIKDIKTEPVSEPKTEAKQRRGEGSDYDYQELQSFDYSPNHISTTWTDVSVTWTYPESKQRVVPEGSVYVPDPTQEFEGGLQAPTATRKRTPRDVSIHWSPAPPVIPDGAFWTLDPSLEGRDGVFAIDSILAPGIDGYSAIDVPNLGIGTFSDQPTGLLILESPIYADQASNPEDEKDLKHQIFGASESKTQAMSVSLRSSRLQSHEYTVPLIAATPTGYLRINYVYEQRILDEDTAYELAKDLSGSIPEVTLSDAKRQHAESKDYNQANEAYLAELKQLEEERVAFHQANIAYSKLQAQRIQSEMEPLQAKLKAGTATQADLDLLDQLKFNRINQESNVISEQDRITEAQTGTYTHSRTPFDERCRAQLIQKCQESVKALGGGIRARKKADYLIGKMTPEQRTIARRILAKISQEGGGLYAEDYRELNEAMQNIFQGDQEYQQAQLEIEVAYENAWVEGAEYVKGGAEVGLMITSLGGGPMYINVAYQTATGFIEKDITEGLKRGISTYSDAMDVMISGYDGWQSGGFWGAVEGASLSLLMNKGPEVAMGRLKFSKGFDGGYHPLGHQKLDTPHLKPDVDAPAIGKKPSTKGAEAIQAAKFQQEMEYGEALAKDYFRDYSRWKTAQIKGDMPPAEFDRLQMQVRQKAAAVAHSMTAKSYLKYQAPPRMGSAFTEVHTEVLDDAIRSFNHEMKQLGFNEQQIVQFRNKSSMDPGMDADLGLIEHPSTLHIKNADGTVTIKENVWLTKNGKPVTVEEWQKAARKVMADNYKHVSGGYSAHQSFVDATTSMHAESYKDLAWLSLPKAGPHADLGKISKAQDQIFAKLNPELTSHDLDITAKKAEIMFKEHPELRKLGSMMETCRGTAKDLDTKFLPLFDSKIRQLEAIPAAKRSPQATQNLKELKSSREYLEQCRKCFNDIGKGATPPTRWMNDFRLITGGEDPIAVTKRLAKMTLDASKA